MRFRIRKPTDYYMGMLNGKRALITGVASKRSIAWGIAEAMRREGAELAFACQNERLKERVDELAQQCGSKLTLVCDVQNDAEIGAMFDTIRHSWDSLDAIVHSIAYAPHQELSGDYIENTTRQGFITAHEISCYSFSALAKAARVLLAQSNGAMLTLSYLGAERYIPNYNVMGLAKASLEANVRYLAACLGPQGIRVNAISAGPIKTLAAAGIEGFRGMLQHTEQTAPLRRNITLEDIGNVGAFLCSKLSSGITGEIIHVDAGYNLVGMASQD